MHAANTYSLRALPQAGGKVVTRTGKAPGSWSLCSRERTQGCVSRESKSFQILKSALKKSVMVMGEEVMQQGKALSQGGQGGGFRF